MYIYVYIHSWNAVCKAIYIHIYIYIYSCVFFSTPGMLRRAPLTWLGSVMHAA